MQPVAFTVPAEVAFDYLVEPHNRPEWQSSLRAVELADGQPRVGQEWVDVTAVGVRPRMVTTVLDRPHTWSEKGVWRGVEATLTLHFTPTDAGCSVAADFVVTGRGIARPLGPVLTRAAVLAVPGDLERAAQVLSKRAAGH